ncbi:MAG: isoprenylcysteine carboxylmethyltransferase family protein [Chloroflexi bacterium]|nr:isoprenylcysteine carboxylmethyltransferase family protein [Chloroflexota bacterium]
MTTTQTEHTTPQNGDLRSGIIRRMVQVLIQVLIQALVPFLAAGTLRWWEAWAYIGIYLVGGIAINSFFMLRLNPEVIAERGRAAQATNWKAWDKIVGIVAAVFYLIGILLVAGLDKRFGWTGPIPLLVQIVAFVLYALGSGLFSWAMISNAYFSTAVRIQEERGHAVCSSGPYRFVRHPGYVGVMLQSLVAPLMFGSLWALLPGVLAVLSLAIRTALEDRMLQDELGGYRDYAQRVRYRLLPGVW